MAKTPYNHILPWVVGSALLLGVFLTPASPAQAQEQSGNPLPGNACTFQNPATEGPVANFVYMDPKWPSYYQKDPEYPGLHFTTGQWAGLDIVQTSLKLPFVSGGTVIANTGSSYDSAGGGYGVTYEGNGDCAGWISGYWHNPTPVAYPIGQQLDANAPAGTPGCTGFDQNCGDKGSKIKPHTHWTLGFRSIEDPFPADIPAYHTVSGNPKIGSVWWINPLRIVPDVSQQQLDSIWYAADQGYEQWYTDAAPTNRPVSIVPILIGVVVVCVILLCLVSGKGKIAFALGGIAAVAFVATRLIQPPPPPQIVWYDREVETSWYSNAPSGAGLDQKGQANGEGWRIIQQAVADAGGTTEQAELLFWTWQSETSVVDCQSWKTKYESDGLANPCVSRAPAKGTFQFMDGTWAKYADRGWDQWTLYGGARGAYEEFNRLKLWGYDSAAGFANRFSGGDGGQVWNKGPDGYNQALWIFNNAASTQPPQ